MPISSTNFAQSVDQSIRKLSAHTRKIQQRSNLVQLKNIVQLLFYFVAACQIFHQWQSSSVDFVSK
jgi:hypothetical protein